MIEKEFLLISLGFLLLLLIYIRHFSSRPHIKRLKYSFLDYGAVKWKVKFSEKGEVSVDKTPYCRNCKIPYRSRKRISSTKLICPACGDVKETYPLNDTLKTVYNISYAKVKTYLEEKKGEREDNE